MKSMPRDSNNGSCWFGRLRLQDAISQQGQGSPRIIHHVIFVCGVKYELSSSTILPASVIFS